MLTLEDAREELAFYIQDKIDGVNVDNPKANRGAKYYISNGLNPEHTIAVAFDIIQLQFQKTASDNPPGECKLTATSTMIGEHILPADENLSLFERWERSIKVGDLHIEAFYNLGYIDIYYPPQLEDEKDRKRFIKDDDPRCHIINPTRKWTDLKDVNTIFIRHALRGSVPEKPAIIEKSTQLVGEEEKDIVKRSKEKIDPDAKWVNAVNKLQRTAWKINDRVLKALNDNKKNFVSPIPIAEPEDPKEIARISKQTQLDYTIAKAQQLETLQEFYQYVEADYRGRLYYSESFLNFQGSDFARGVMLFARAKPMDKHGLFWLAVHTACSYNQSYGIDEIPDWCEADYATYLKDEGLESISVDKMTLEDRVSWTNQNMDWIREAGVDCNFFFEAEKSVSFLACCIEWHDFHIAYDAGKVYRTRLPIPIDGSNNGWQHLGAISKDPLTGKLVGLKPVDIQQDFYVQTAKELYNLTEDRLRDILDRMPMKHIRKGISKRGSMTRAYSAGAAKIGENMWFDCRTEDFNDKYGITKADCMAFAKLLVKAISIVCPGPLRTMGYLQTLAGITIANGKETITWTTPSGFNVTYACNHTNKVKTKSTIKGYTKYNDRGVVNHVAQLETEFPDMRGFMCGISPNYIHSMDASHMALVIDKWNGDFGAVHDSFSTHAPDVELLLAHTKREFIDMYDVDNYYRIIEDQLVEDLDDITTDRPELGDLDIEEIQDSDYFFA